MVQNAHYGLSPFSTRGTVHRYIKEQQQEVPQTETVPELHIGLRGTHLREVDFFFLITQMNWEVDFDLCLSYLSLQNNLPPNLAV